MAADTAVMEPPEAAETAAPVKAPEVEAAKEKPKAEKAAKDKGKKDKGKATATAEIVADGPSVAGHPRASRAVARAKSWGGLGGFLVGGYLSLPIGTLAEAAMRALVAGVVCYVAVWAAAVFVWRRLVVLEIKAREQQLLNAIQAAGARRELAGGSGAERPGQRVAS